MQGTRRWCARLAGVLLASGLMATGAGALSLADLSEGESFTTANGVTFEHFAVKVKGKLSSDLADYEVVQTADGFFLHGYVAAGRGRKAGQGRLKIRYDISSETPEGLLGGGVGIDPGSDLLAVKKQLFDGDRRIAKLLATTKGALSDEIDLDGPLALRVRETIQLGNGFAGGAVASRFVAAPEPSTAVLLGSALAAAAALRRRRGPRS